MQRKEELGRVVNRAPCEADVEKIGTWRLDPQRRFLRKNLITLFHRLHAEFPQATFQNRRVNVIRSFFEPSAYIVLFQVIRSRTECRY